MSGEVSAEKTVTIIPHERGTSTYLSILTRNTERLATDATVNPRMLISKV
jgi:hypothetical protein